MTKITPAIVDRAAQIDPSVEIGPYCLVGPGATLHRGVKLLSHAIIEGVTEVGEDCVLHPFSLHRRSAAALGPQGRADPRGRGPSQRVPRTRHGPTPARPAAAA